MKSRNSSRTNPFEQFLTNGFSRKAKQMEKVGEWNPHATDACFPTGKRRHSGEKPKLHELWRIAWKDLKWEKSFDSVN